MAKSGEIINPKIDAGTPFDWGRTSADYAKYRDIYPPQLYDKIISRGLCTAGQRVLDVGTGTGVLPRHLYHHGAHWTAADISANQIAAAKQLAGEANMAIDFRVSPAEELDFPDASFDVITACQCFWYFDHAKTAPLFRRMIRVDGRLLVLYMAWLPFEDQIAGVSEALVLKYSPQWSGARETRHPISIPDEVLAYFDLVHHEEFDVRIPFTRETWHGRMKACRGVGASLAGESLAAWEAEHRALLLDIVPQTFCVLHYVAIAELRAKNSLIRENEKSGSAA